MPPGRGVYHRRVHRDTGQAPLERFEAGTPPRLPSPAELGEALLWSARRRVAKTATSAGTAPPTSRPAAGRPDRRAGLRPFDLTQIQVRYQAGRWDRHPAADRPPRPPQGPPEPADTPPPPTGIDYLALVQARDEQATRQRIAEVDLPLPGLEPPSQQPTPPRPGGPAMTIQRLQAHHGFTRMPFGRDLAPGMLHRSRGHAEAVARIGWLVCERAIGVVTGEVGAGKTVAARAAVAALDPSRHTVIYQANPAVGARGLDAAIVTALGGMPRFHKAALLPQASEAVLAEEAERGKRVVLLVDEAHLLTYEQLEELRLLTNADMDAQSPFALLLLGQPTLRRKLKLGTFAALAQRIALRYELPGMDPAETSGYIHHHLALAGRSDPLSSDDAIALVHHQARGMPRAVNNLAIQAPVAAIAHGKAIIDEASARAAVTELSAD